MVAGKMPAIARSARKSIERALAKHPEHRAAFAGAAARSFKDGKSAARLEEFIRAPMFRAFAAGMAKATPGRFLFTCEILFERLLAGDRPSSVAAAGALMASPRFKAVASLYLRPPGDRDGFRRFMTGLVELSVRLGSISDEHLAFFASRECALLREAYRGDRDVLDALMDTMMHLLAVKASPEEVRRCADLMSTDHARTLLLMSGVIGMGNAMLASLVHVLVRHPDPARFFRMLELFCTHYRPSHFHSEGLIRMRFTRLADLWRVFWFAGDDDGAHLGGFINAYGREESGTGRKIWDRVLGREPTGALGAIRLIDSGAFNDLRNRYGREPAAVALLARHLADALSREEGASRDAIVRAILHTGIEAASLARRAEFFDWLDSRSTSRSVSGIIEGYCFIEYLVHDAGEALTSHIDGGHRAFLALIDTLYHRADVPRYTLFATVLKHARDRLWAPAAEAFPACGEMIGNMRAIAEMACIEDEVIATLRDLGPGEIGDYHDHLLSTWLDTPARVRRAAGPDDWHSLTFAEALPYCIGTVAPIIGMIAIRESNNDVASTDGRAIFLPRRLSLFNDPRYPLEENRNLAAYVSLSLHEAGHIIGGSYHFDMSDIIQRLERPELFRMVLNVFEDYRVESFIVRMGAHPQAKELFGAYNRRMVELLWPLQIPPGARLLSYINNTAGGHDSGLIHDPGYRQVIDDLLSMDLPAGPFGGLGDLARYGVDRLRGMDVSNPLSSFHLAEEFYDIMKSWPEDALAGMSDTIMLPPPGAMECFGGNGESRPLTREELEELYRRCNSDPAGFVREQGLRPCQDSPSPGTGMDPLPARHDVDYESRGTMDDSTRTLVDEILARRQEENIPDDRAAEIVNHRRAGKPRDPLLEQFQDDIDSAREKRRTRDVRPAAEKCFTRMSEIREYVVKKTNPAFMARFRRYEPLVGRVYLELSRLLPAIEDEYETSSDDGEIDTELLVEALSDRRNRHEKPEIYETVRRDDRRSIEVVIGLDASGSTSGYVNRDRTTILDVEKAFAIILGRALKFITPEVSVYAFNSMTSTNIYRAATFQAVSGFSSDGANRDGDFIRYLTARLARSSAETRFFFLLSDGMPMSINYCGTEALEDTLLAMREALNAGIKLVYYNFDSRRSDYFESFQKVATYARHFTDPRQILPTIPELLKSIAQSAL
ncbi:MAG: hypothetical protein JW838_00755 [Spirochaetes bacterium]|nr:hypothetical protein [Spirochaetota bacterium]